jgi:hypothetical protein
MTPTAVNHETSAEVISLPRAILWLTALGCTTVALAALGAVHVLPADTSWSELPTWVATSEPHEPVMAVVWLVALGSSVHLFVSSLLVAAECAGSPSLRHRSGLAARLLVPAALRVTLRVALSRSLVVGLAVSPPAVALVDMQQQPVALSDPATKPPTIRMLDTVRAANAEGPTIRWVGGDDTPPTHDDRPPHPMDRHLPPGPETRNDAGAGVDTRVVVQRGDHAWSIAETALARHLGRTPSEQETTGYWRRLLRHNHHRLADPNNPDLLHVGQHLALPPPDVAKGRPSN